MRLLDTVYIVVSRFVDETEIVGVFDSEDKARICMDQAPSDRQIQRWMLNTTEPQEYL